MGGVACTAGRRARAVKARDSSIVSYLICSKYNVSNVEWYGCLYRDPWYLDAKSGLEEM
jgi:hypothetical protein